MSPKINETSSAEIIHQKFEEVQSKLRQLDFLNQYVLETIESFAFRYFDEPNTPVQISNNVMVITALENGIKEAIKIKNLQLRAGIGELVKRVSKEQGPTILREIRVIIERNANHGGQCQTIARVSFGHPEHDFKVGTYVEKLSLFKFDDEIHFRNTLAKNLELVCELF